MKKLSEEIAEIKRLSGITEGDVVQFEPRPVSAAANRANTIEDDLNQGLPNLGPDKRLMADFNEQYATIEVWIETEEVTTVIDIQTVEKAVNLVQEAHFIGIQPLSNGIKLIFSMR